MKSLYKLVSSAKVIHFLTFEYYRQHKLKADRNTSIKNDRDGYPYVFVFFDYFCTKIKPIQMKEDKSQLMNYAMNSGLILGGFWVFKYLFVIGATQFPFLGIVQSLLSIGTPLILLYFIVKYKNQIEGSRIGFWHGVQFSMLLFFYAGLIEAIIVMIHVLWIDPNYISNTFENIISIAESLPVDQNAIEQVRNQPVPTPFLYTLNLIMSDVLIGIVLSLLIVPLAMKIEVTRQNENSRKED